MVDRSRHHSQYTLALLLVLLIIVSLTSSLRAQTEPLPVPTAQSGLSGRNGLSSSTPMSNAPLTLISPVDGATDVSSSPIFRWRMDLDTTVYTLVVKRKQKVISETDFEANAICSGDICSVSLPALNLKNGKSYEWLVRSNRNDLKLKSAKQTFMVEQNSILPILYTDNFDTGDDFSNWMENIAPRLIANSRNRSLPIQGNQTLLLSYGYISDVNLQVQTYINAGTALLKVRESGAGNYTALFQHDGQIMLYRGDQLLTPSVVAPQLGDGSIHLLGLKAIGEKISISVDGVELLTIHDPKSLPYGVIGLGGNSDDADLVFDNLYVEGKTAQEPLSGIDLISPLIPEANRMRVNPIVADNNNRSTVGKLFFTDFSDIYTINADGSNRQLFITGSAPQIRPAYSAVVNSLAFLSAYDGAYQVWVAPVSGISHPRRLTSTGSVQGGPSWSPNGSEIAYEVASNIYIVNVNTLGTRWLTDGVEPDWSSSNKFVFANYSTGPGTFLWTINPDGTGLLRVPNIAFKYADVYPDWSADGTKIVMHYLPHNSTSTTQQVCIVTIATGALQCVTGEVGTTPDPNWSIDGTSIAYHSFSSGVNRIKIIPANGGAETTLTTGSNVEWVSGSVLINPTPTPIRMETLTPNFTPTFTPTPPPSLNDYGIIAIGWNAAQQAIILDGVQAIADSFKIITTTNDSKVVVFKRVMGTDNSPISVIYDSNLGGFCETDNNNRTITCDDLTQPGNLSLSIPFSPQVFVHEFGHVLDTRVNRLADYLSTAFIGDCTSPNPERVMGEITDANGNVTSGWTRGERGWGSGPATYGTGPNFPANPKRLITIYQQNPLLQGHPGGNRTNRVEEATADMFLNWVYRRSVGAPSNTPCTTNVPGKRPFRNKKWIAPNDFATSATNGVNDNTRPGSKRFKWMDNTLVSIFTSKGW